ncbi:MAG: hypothetical protein NTY19_25090 [Planctomycetota bacterium]|nr:hypothetical protein [Planctomycetota bacterium]
MPMSMNDYLIDYLLHEYLPAFASTIAIELGVAVMLGFWRAPELSAVLLVNIVTHPALHAFLWVVFCTKVLPLTWPLLLVLEAVVFLAEWGMLARLLRLSATRAGLVALTINTASALLGLMLSD